MNKEISMENLFNIISEIMGKQLTYITSEERIRPTKSEVDRLVCDNTKIMTQTNWSPKYGLKEGLLKTIEWLTNNFKNYKSGIYHV